LTNEEIEYPNKSIGSNIKKKKKSPTKEMSRSDPFNAEFYKTFEEALPTLFKLF
jgi:hypothetical protein